MAERVAECAAAVSAISFPATAVILASPHGEGRGIYAGRHGDLDGFGRSGVRVETSPAGDLARELRLTWDAPSLGVPYDHGIVTPLALGLMPRTQLIAVATVDAEDGRALARAVAKVADHRPTKVAFVASAHLGAALTDRAPRLKSEAALALEDEVLTGIKEDARVLSDRAERLEMTAGSCSAATLAAFGTLFEGHALELNAYSRAFGVGYLVATVAV